MQLPGANARHAMPKQPDLSDNVPFVHKRFMLPAGILIHGLARDLEHPANLAYVGFSFFESSDDGVSIFFLTR